MTKDFDLRSTARRFTFHFVAGTIETFPDWTDMHMMNLHGFDLEDALRSFNDWKARMLAPSNKNGIHEIRLQKIEEVKCTT